MTFFSMFLMLVLNSQVTTIFTPFSHTSYLPYKWSQFIFQVNLIRDNARLTASLAALKKMAENNARAMGNQPGNDRSSRLD
jgi:hypothetical protein